MLKFYKKFSKLKSKNNKHIDYKDLNILKGYITECSKIMPSRVTGVSSKYQRQLSLAIKYARYLSFITYTDVH